VTDSSIALSTRDRIITTAAALFAERGYMATSIGDITKDLGLTRGALYFHFTSKAELALEVANKYFEAWGPILEAAEQEGLRGLDTLRWISYRVGVAYREDVVVRAAVRLWRESTEIEADLPAPFVGWIQTTERYLEEELADGRLVEGLDLQKVAWQIVASFFGTQDVSNQLEQRRDLEQRIDTMWEIILRGVRSPDAR